jgi:hypothetical protein
MRNSGLVSVGHLLASKVPLEYKLTFQHFGTILMCSFSDKEIHKMEGRWRFDQVSVAVYILSWWHRPRLPPRRLELWAVRSNPAI